MQKNNNIKKMQKLFLTHNLERKEVFIMLPSRNIERQRNEITTNLTD